MPVTAIEASSSSPPSSSAAVSPEIYAILREKLERMLETSSSGGFGYQQAAAFRLHEIKLQGVYQHEVDGELETAPARGASAQVSVDFEIVEEMCNMMMNAHGGFLAYAVDVISSLPLLCLSGHERWSSSGVSTNINMYYISAAPVGTLVRVTANVVAQGKVVSVIEATVEERDTGRIIARGTHVKQDIPNLGHKFKL